jgi:hypothetical protein
MEKVLIGIFAVIGAVAMIAGFGLILAFPIKWLELYNADAF